MNAGEIREAFSGSNDLRAEVLTEIAAQLAELNDSLGKIARALEVTIAIEGGSVPPLGQAEGHLCIVPNCNAKAALDDDYCRMHRRERNEKLGVPNG